MRSQDARLAVSCKTAGCEADLLFDTTILPASLPDRPTVVPINLPDDFELTCPDCGNKHSYRRSDIFEKAV